MKFYQLDRNRPNWVAEESATNRQKKLLRFFGFDGWESIKKGPAGGLIGRLFADKEKSLLWEKYCFSTGDVGHDSCELLPYDLEKLKAVKIPEDWKFPSKPRKKSYKRRIHLALDILEDGSPFDDPIPEIDVSGKRFVFTGTFTFGSRPKCKQETELFGGITQEGVNSETDFLVVGNEGSEAWLTEKAGNKILNAMVKRIDGHHIKIIAEGDWIGALQDHEKAQ